MTTTISDDHPMNMENDAPLWQAWRDHRDVLWAADANASSYQGPMDTAALQAIPHANTAICFDRDHSEESRDE